MGKNGGKSQDEFIELGGWEIKKVKDGLDEAQVTSIINELVSQRDKLTQRTDHLSTLTNLAERTVTEADKLAEEMKTQAIERAKNETASLIAEAEVKAQKLENETKKIQTELRNSIQGILNNLLSQLDSLKQQVESLQEESEQKLSQPAESDKLLAETANETPVDDQEPVPAIHSTDISEETEQAPAAKQQETTQDSNNLNLELEILPPLDIMKVMEIVTYLDNLPEIDNTELIPNTERPLIIVSLREPIDLSNMLSAIPEVANLEEDKAEPADKGKPRKFRINLSVESAVQEVKKG